MFPAKTITIHNTAYSLRQSMRALLYFEEETGRQLADMKGLSDLVRLFYYTLKACNRETFSIEYDAFVDLLDEIPELQTEYSNYMESTKSTKSEDSEKKKDFG